MLQSVDEDEKLCVNNPYALKGQQEQGFLTEDGLCEVLMQSRKMIAKQFKKQVKAILKEIRRTGSYSANKVPTSFKEALLLAVDQQEQIEKLEADKLMLTETINEQQPKVEYCDNVLASENSINAIMVAKILGFPSAKRLNYLLKMFKVQYKLSNEWSLYSKCCDKGYVCCLLTMTGIGMFTA